MNSEEVAFNVKLNNAMGQQIVASKALNMTNILNRFVQRFLTEIPYLLVVTLIDGKLTNAEKQMIIDKVVTIVKDVLKDL